MSSFETFLVFAPLLVLATVMTVMLCISLAREFRRW
jgi:hypothetical protein